MANLQVFLFGRFRCQYAQMSLAGIEATKAQELLTLLALSGGRLHHREVLADKLWEEKADAKKGLRQALWQVQSALLPVATATGIPCLTTNGDWIGLNPAAGVWVDAIAVEATYHRYRAVADTQLTQEQAADVQQAANHYQGDLLEGCYLDFCLQERERYQFFYLSLLDKLLGYCESKHDYPGGVDCAQRILRCDRARESTHRRLMRLHYLAGYRVRALHQYKICVDTLGKDLGVRPGRATQELYRLVSNDDFAAVSNPSHTTPANAEAKSHAVPDATNAQTYDVREAILRLQADMDTLLAKFDRNVALIPPPDLPASPPA